MGLAVSPTSLGVHLGGSGRCSGARGLRNGPWTWPESSPLNPVHTALHPACLSRAQPLSATGWQVQDS